MGLGERLVVKRLIRWLVRRVAMRSGRFVGLYRRLCRPNGREYAAYAEFLRRHGGLYAMGLEAIVARRTGGVRFRPEPPPRCTSHAHSTTP